MEKYAIRENSLVARLAAWKLRSDSVAIVIGRTIHLHHASAGEFLRNTRWVRHELVHIRQFRRHGFLPFMALYVWESWKRGYHNNKYEAEARAGEHDAGICSAFGIMEGSVRSEGS